MIPDILSVIECLYITEFDNENGGQRWTAVLDSSALVKAASVLAKDGYHLEDVCGLNTIEAAVSVYHFDCFYNPGRLTLVVTAPYPTMEFPSIAMIYQGAEWHERETRDFFGFIYKGNPNFVPLLLSREMMCAYPLVKPEKDRAPFHVFFNPEVRKGRVLYKAEGFTLADLPAEKDAVEPVEKTQPGQLGTCP